EDTHFVFNEYSFMSILLITLLVGAGSGVHRHPFSLPAALSSVQQSQEFFAAEKYTITFPPKNPASTAGYSYLPQNTYKNPAESTAFCKCAQKPDKKCSRHVP